MPSNAKNIGAIAKKKTYTSSEKFFRNKIHARFKIPHRPHNLSNGLSLSRVTFLNNKNSDQK